MLPFIHTPTHWGSSHVAVTSKGERVGLVAGAAFEYVDRRGADDGHLPPAHLELDLHILSRHQLLGDVGDALARYAIDPDERVADLQRSM